MRSRDGNRNLKISISLLIIFNSLVLNASEYLISYNYTIKNMTIYDEQLQISHTMKKCSGESYNPIILDTNHKSNLKKIINSNIDTFIQYIHTLGLDVKHNSKTINNINSSTTILTLKTTCFKVDFNDSLVKISPLK